MLLSTDCHGRRAVATAILRASLGLTLVFIGLTNYMQFGSYTIQVSDGLGPLEFLGTVWSYILPGLFIVGGALFTINVFADIAIWLVGIGLASIPPGMVVKSVLSGVDLNDMMVSAVQALIWLIAFLLVVKGMACGDRGCTECAARAKASQGAAPKRESSASSATRKSNLPRF